MPVFISYSHSDRDFATRLAEQLVRHRATVWIDQWELLVGDSLIERIEAALEEASALLVILSASSVQSDWCRKELNAGLLKELEEKRVVILPVLLEDCKIPLFLRDKLYADFRTDFDEGLKDVLESVARFSSQTLGRVENPQWHVDWSVEWDISDPDSLSLVWTMIDQARDAPFSCLTEIRVDANPKASRLYALYAEKGYESWQQQVILEMVADAANDVDLRVLLEDEMSVFRLLEISDSQLKVTYKVSIRSRRLGQDTGRDIVLDIGKRLDNIRNELRKTTRPPSPNTLAAIHRLRENLQ